MPAEIRLPAQEHPAFVIRAEHVGHIAQAASVRFRFQGAIVVEYPAELEAYLMVADGEPSLFLDPVNERLPELPVFVQIKQLFPGVFDVVVHEENAVPVKDLAVHRYIPKPALGKPVALVIFGDEPEFKAVNVSVFVVGIMKAPLDRKSVV